MTYVAGKHTRTPERGLRFRPFYSRQAGQEHQQRHRPDQAERQQHMPKALHRLHHHTVPKQIVEPSARTAQVLKRPHATSRKRPPGGEA